MVGLWYPGQLEWHILGDEGAAEEAAAFERLSRVLKGN